MERNLVCFLLVFLALFHGELKKCVFFFLPKICNVVIAGGMCASRISYLDDNIFVEDAVKKHRTPIMFARSLDGVFNESLLCEDSSDDFPQFFSPKQRKEGAVVVAIMVGIYCFTLLALICDNYFLPCVERICEVFNISEVSK